MQKIFTAADDAVEPNKQFLFPSPWLTETLRSFAHPLCVFRMTVLVRGGHSSEKFVVSNEVRILSFSSYGKSFLAASIGGGDA
jgi:hypothetical protein